MPVQVCHPWCVKRIGHRILIEGVTRAGVPAMAKITCRPQFEDPASSPVKIDWRIGILQWLRGWGLVEIKCAECAPSSIIGIQFQIPFLRGPVGNSPNYCPGKVHVHICCTCPAYHCLIVRLAVEHYIRRTTEGCTYGNLFYRLPENTNVI